MAKDPDILCIGSVLWDVIGRAPVAMQQGSDVAGRITRLPGGVALNIAVTLARFGMTPALLSAVGRDAEGDELIAACEARGLITDFCYRSDDLPTDVYMAVEGANGLIAAIADAHSLEAAGDKILAPLTDGRLSGGRLFGGRLSDAPLSDAPLSDAPLTDAALADAAPTDGDLTTSFTGPVALDGNLTVDLLSQIATRPLLAQADLRVAPASPGKAERLLPFLRAGRGTLYVNREEAGRLCKVDFANSAKAAQGLLVRGAARVLVTDGGAPASEASAEGVITQTPRDVMVTRVTGAGDTFMAAHIAAEARGADRADALAGALEAAATYVSGGTPK